MIALTLKRQWLPAGAQTFLRRRAIECIGALLIAVSAFFAVALLSYSPDDPSPNRAVSGPIRNIGGHWGATLADVSLQSLGLASAVPAIVLFAWGFRLMRVHQLPLWWARIALLPVAITATAVALAFWFPHAPEGWPRPFDVGLGGIAGKLFLTWILSPVQSIGFGAPGLAIIAGLSASVALVFLLAVTWGEWRALGRSFGTTGLAVVTLFKRLRSLALRLRDPAKRRAEEKAERRRERRDPALDGDPAIERGSADDASRRPSPSELVETPARESAPKPKRSPRKQASLELGDGTIELPRLDLLRMPKPEDRSASVDETALAQNARLLETVLDDFGVQGRIVKVRPGPVVTLYELEPAPGTKAARVIGLADDIARSMSAISVRVAVVPGRNVIGIELPNATRETVFLRELLADPNSDLGGHALSLALGKDIGGTPVVADLARMPHLLIAGTTGSGKSVAINTMILSLLYRHSPANCRFIMVDPKMIELSVYDGIPHLLAPVVTDPKKSVTALKWVVREM
ncbi:MAG: cell division protein FtsK, partial [Alphaproteobacteria bacterium]|nr:cell division protein FtsK [Alphaproteobacteria bacterium]